MSVRARGLSRSVNVLRGPAAVIATALACHGAIDGEQNGAGGANAGPGAGSGGPGASPTSPGGPGAATGNMGVRPGPEQPPPPMGKAVLAPRIGALHGAIGLRRLTRLEYGNTVADLLGVKGAEAAIEEDDTIEFLSNNQNAMKVGLADLESYERAANKISMTALASLQLPAGCVLDTLAGDCVARFLNDFLVRAFRRPPTPAEISRLNTLFTQLAMADGSRSEALRGVIQSVLLSPSFLYRTELGADGRTLGAWEIASRLSYLLWATMPDAELFARAKDDGLRSRPTLEAQLQRLLSDPRAQRGVANIIFEWFGMHGTQLAKKGKDVLVGLSVSSLQTAIEDETKRFIAETLVAPGGSFEGLYGARHSYVNDASALVYGLKGITGKELRKVDLDPTQRRGLFTQPLLLATHSKESGYSTVQMGRFVRERLLCQLVPPPPPDTVTELKETPANANLPYRQKFEEHATNGVCRACHSTLDPPGFAFLSHDPVGRFKAKDPAGVPFDTKGDLLNVDEKSFPFSNAVTMLDGVRSSQEAKGCFARKFVEYTFGRTLAKADVPLYEKLVWRLEAKGDFAAFLADVVLSQEFGQRGPDEVK